MHLILGAPNVPTWYHYMKAHAMKDKPCSRGALDPEMVAVATALASTRAVSSEGAIPYSDKQISDERGSGMGAKRERVDGFDGPRLVAWCKAVPENEQHRPHLRTCIASDFFLSSSSQGGTKACWWRVVCESVSPKDVLREANSRDGLKYVHPRQRQDQRLAIYLYYHAGAVWFPRCPTLFFLPCNYRSPWGWDI
ncbi:hypothetical protein RJ55_04373 [Drechmeria coniospora]|nr:hypothetical protein RJ55_04373 [Drechmeria coniospora]